MSWKKGQSGNPVTQFKKGHSGNPYKRYMKGVVRVARMENFETLHKQVTRAFEMSHLESVQLLSGPKADEMGQAEQLIHQALHHALEEGDARYIAPFLQIYCIPADKADEIPSAEDLSLLEKVKTLLSLPYEERVEAFRKFLEAAGPRKSAQANPASSG